jgi:hypothetical protein
VSAKRSSLEEPRVFARRLEGWTWALMVRDGAEEAPPHHED